VSQPVDKRRILIIDDSETIHVDFRRVLAPEKSKSQGLLDSLEEEIFGTLPRAPAEPEFEVSSALQGQQALALVKQALAEGRPYTLVFLDYQMPPGWNGVETLRQLRRVDPHLPVVFFSAYSNYSWEDITAEFGISPMLVEMRKPFSSMELRRLALSLSDPKAFATIH
jgi:CheY-like chemotaxis protein